MRSSDLSEDQICLIEESIKREEEEELERSTAKEKWLREREEKKRALQVELAILKNCSKNSYKSQFSTQRDTFLLKAEGQNVGIFRAWFGDRIQRTEFKENQRTRKCKK